PSDPGRPPHPRIRYQRWALDTRFTGEAYAWRHHLVEAGLDPNRFHNGSTNLVPLGGSPQGFPVRNADLWLVSNLAPFQSTPLRIDLNRRLAFRERSSLPDPESNCPLLGMRALERAGLKVLIDFRRGTVSVWTPESWFRQTWFWFRRMPSGFRPLTLPWPD